MKLGRWVAAAAVLLLAGQCWVLAQDNEPGEEPGETQPGEEQPPEEQPAAGAKIRARTAADAMLLLPQLGSAGPEGALDNDTGKISEIHIEAEGAAELKGFVSVPSPMDKARKHALVFALHGDGLETKKELAEAAKLSCGRDPLILCSLQYMKETDRGNFRSIDYLVDRDVLFAAFSWLLAKVKADYPVDPERVFLLGSNGGGLEAAHWSRTLWEGDPDNFPFRARPFYDMVLEGADEKDSIPPVATVIVTNNMHMDISKAFGEATPRRFANELLSWGIPAQFHNYELTFGQEDTTWVRAVRDAINTLGGPGPGFMKPTAREVGVPGEEDKLKFADSQDRYVGEVLGLCQSENFTSAVRRGNEFIADKNIGNKEKKPIKEFMKELETWAKKEVERCNTSLESSIKADMWPHSLRRKRLEQLIEAYKDAGWLKGKPYAANLEKLKTFGPAKRTAERGEAMRAAIKLELEGKRTEAKAAYDKLARDIEKDAGACPWPHAAKFRLTWWEKLE